MLDGQIVGSFLSVQGMHTHTHTHTCMHACMHTYTHMHSHTHTCIHSHIHIHTHTHTPNFFFQRIKALVLFRVIFFAFPVRNWKRKCDCFDAVYIQQKYLRQNIDSLNVKCLCIYTKRWNIILLLFIFVFVLLRLFSFRSNFDAQVTLF